MVISDTQTLSSFCERLEQEPFITVDTEFIRERTYWPILCLIQVGAPDEAACIDPLAEGIDLAPLFKLLKNEKVLKVFHSARQDIEIFYHLAGFVPMPLFDTQVGAMVCGMGESVSYQTLVHKFLKTTLDKSTRFTDWSHRPLTPKQIEYALSDVTHLVPVYEKMRDRLNENGRTLWVQNEMNHLTNPALYEVKPEEMWLKIKRTTDNPLFVALLKELAAWREKMAQAIDKPRKYVLKDEALLEIAASKPQTPEALAELRTISSGFVKNNGAEIIGIIQSILALPVESLPKIAKIKPPSPVQKNIKEMLKVILTLVCEQAGVAPKIVASPSDLDEMAASDTADVLPMKGWRYDLFGKKALAFKAGQMAVCFNPKTHQMEFIEKKACAGLPDLPSE